MTHKEAIQKYYEFRDTYNGQYLDYDGEGYECWDLAQTYFVKYLGVPDYVLGGCGLVSNMLYPPKIYDLLDYFVEVPLDQMDPGDIVIWDSNIKHIACFDNWDGEKCWYFSQNPGPCQITTINAGGQHAFRLKTNDPSPVDYKELYEQEVEKNNILQEKINNAIKDLS